MPSLPEKHSTHFSQHNEVLCGMCVGANGTEQGRREKECHVLLPPIRTHLDTATQGYVALGHMGDTVEGEGGALRVKRSSGRGADSAQEHFQPPQRVVGGRSVSQSATMGSSQWLRGTGAAVGSGDERALRGQRLEKSREVGRRRNNFVVEVCLRDTFNFRCGINSVGLRRKDSKGVLQTSCP